VREAGDLVQHGRDGSKLPLLGLLGDRGRRHPLQLGQQGRQLAVILAKVHRVPLVEGLAAPAEGRDTVIVDTAGRLHIDEAMMAEVAAIVAAIRPQETLLVVDAMAGQDAVDSASAFHARIRLTGLMLAKVDSDARGGAPLSIHAATGIPVKLMGTGEKLDAIEVFHPDRLAQRILGMGDIVTLVERAQEVVDRKDAEDQARRLLEARFTLDDFLSQLRQLRKMGPLTDLLKMIPGVGQLSAQLPSGPEAEREIRRIEAIISSMTRAERADPSIVDGSRRKRIARGSGTQVSDVNQLLRQFQEMRKLMKQLGPMVKGGRLPRLPGMPRA